jgi:hypothetical protein
MSEGKVVRTIQRSRKSLKPQSPLGSWCGATTAEAWIPTTAFKPTLFKPTQFKPKMSCAAATEKHGVAGKTCASCPDCRICDCACNVCVLARKAVAGQICERCGEICGDYLCYDCYLKQEEEDDRAAEEGPICLDCNQEWCPGGVFCPAASRDSGTPECRGCGSGGCGGCPSDDEEEEEERDEPVKMTVERLYK